MREMRNVCKMFVVKPEGKGPLGILGHRLEDNIKMDLNERGQGGGVDWIHVVQGTDWWWVSVNMVMSLWVL
jgi:hypothetical protein